MIGPCRGIFCQKEALASPVRRPGLTWECVGPAVKGAEGKTSGNRRTCGPSSGTQAGAAEGRGLKALAGVRSPTVRNRSL